MTVSDYLLILGLLCGVIAGMILALKFAVVKPKITALLLDADGTLLDFDRAEQTALEKAFSHFGYPFSARTLEEYHRINLACWKRLEKGEITRARLKTLRFEELFSVLGTEGDAEKIWPVYEGFLSECGFVFDGAAEACKRLSKKYALYLVTNGTKTVQTKRLAASGITPCFKEIYISEDVCYAKPDPRFFDRVFSDHPKLKRTQTMIVGDSLSGDIAGGIGAGIHTCWINRTGETRPADLKIDLELDDITKLEKEL